jgi:hypothetical protein
MAVAELVADPAVHAWEQRDDLGESRWAYHSFRHYRDAMPTHRSLDRAYSSCLANCPRARRRATAVNDPSTNTQTDAPVNTVVSAKRPLKGCSPQWVQWSQRFLWKERAAAWDRFVERQGLQKRLDEIELMNKRHSALSVAFINKLVERLQAFNVNELNPTQMVSWLREAVAIERRARGEPVDIAQTTSDVRVSAVPAADELRRSLMDAGLLQSVGR